MLISLDVEALSSYPSRKASEGRTEYALQPKGTIELNDDMTLDQAIRLICYFASVLKMAEDAEVSDA